MASIFTGVITITKRANGAADSRKIKRMIAENLEKEKDKIRLEMSRKTDADTREMILGCVNYLSIKHSYLSGEKQFDFRIERHRHKEDEQYSLVFRVGGSGDRFSKRVGFVSDILPELQLIMKEQYASMEKFPLTPRAIADVERLLSFYGIR
jgi:hypothetical protein